MHNGVGIAISKLQPFLEKRYKTKLRYTGISAVGSNGEILPIFEKDV